MALRNPITKLETFKTYMQDVGLTPTYRISKAFTCGLPGVWLYMKSLGLEDKYFDLLAKAKKQSVYFKELFYLLILTNKNNNFFPKVDDDLLNIQIPDRILDAQIELAQPEFEMAYDFTAAELKETLAQICVPNKMIRLGNKTNAVGIMLCDGNYCVYHADNTETLEYKDLNKCVDAVLRVMNRESV